jgi:hypothetical protein
MTNPSKEDLTLGDAGRLLRPGFHDGHLIGIELLADKEAIVKLRRLSGERYELHLFGVDRLLCDGFAEDNIIGDIYLVSRSAPPIAVLRAMMIGPHPSAAAKYHEQYEEMLRRNSDLIEQGERTLVYVDTSYGGDLYALCRSAEMTFQGT